MLPFSSTQTIVVAEMDGERVGMGRLVPAGEGACELGGMFVDDRYRGREIDRAVVVMRRVRGCEWQGGG